MSPPLLPRMTSSSTLPSPTQGPRTNAPPVPLNTAFDYDPYSVEDDDDDDETRRPTTRGTLMSREQLPTPPFLPTVAASLPYIPQLDSPVSPSFPQSPTTSVHNLTLSNHGPLFSPLLQQTIRTNSLTSLSNQSLTSNTQVPSPTFVSSHQRPFDATSPIMSPPSVPTLNMSSLRGPLTPPHHSPKSSQRHFSMSSQSPLADEMVVEDLLQQMELEDSAFAATEQRISTSGWTTETELGELRAKRHDVRREWEGRIEVARKKRRGSEGLFSHGTIISESSGTPVITLQATPNLSAVSTPTIPPQS
jgi:hypothetical protein